MSYRDAQEALRAKAEALETEVRVLRRRVKHLQREKDPGRAGELAVPKVWSDPSAAWWGVPAVEGVHTVSTRLDENGRNELAQAIRAELDIESTVAFSDVGSGRVLSGRGHDGMSVTALSTESGTTLQLSMDHAFARRHVLLCLTVAALALLSRNILVVGSVFLATAFWSRRWARGNAKRRERRIKLSLERLITIAHTLAPDASAAGPPALVPPEAPTPTS